jgi:hypothetical protein
LADFHTLLEKGAEMVATAIVFFPAVLFFLFMHGEDTTIPKGTEITAYGSIAEMRLAGYRFSLNDFAAPTHDRLSRDEDAVER